MSGLRPSTPEAQNNNINQNDGRSGDPPRSPNNNNNNDSSAPFLSNQPSSANSAAHSAGGGGGGLLSTSPSHRASVIGSSNNGHLSHPNLHPNRSSTRASNASYQRSSTRGSAAVKGKFVLMRSNAGGVTSPVGSTRSIRSGVTGGALPLPPNPSHPHFGRANSIQREAGSVSRPTSGSDDDDDEEDEDDEEEEEFDRKAFREVASEINVNVNALIKKLQAAESGGHKETMLRAKLRQNTRGGGSTEARVVDVAYLASPSASSRPHAGGSKTPSPVGSGKFTGAAVTGGPINVEAAFAAAAGGTIGANYRKYGTGDDDIYSVDGGGEFEEEDEYDEEDAYYFGDDDGDGGSGESDDVSQDNLNAHNNGNSNNGASGDFYSAHGRGGHHYNLRGDAVVDLSGGHSPQQRGSGGGGSGGNLTPSGNSPSVAANGGGSISGKFRAALPTSVGGASNKVGGNASRHGSIVSDINTEMGPPSHSTIGGEQSQSLLASNDDGNGSATDGGGGGRKRRPKLSKAAPVKKGITFSKNEVSDVVVYEVGNELYVGVSFKRSWIGWAAAAAALVCDTAFDVHMIYVLYHVDGNVTSIQNWVSINRLFVSAITVILAFVLKIGMRPLRWVLSTVGFVALCLMSLCLALGAAFEVITIEVTGQAHFYVASVMYCVWLIAYRIIRKEMIFFVEVAATLVAVGGFMLSGFSTDIASSTFDATLGNVLVLVASLCYACYFVLIDRLRRRAPVVPMAAIQGVFAVVVGIPLALGFGNSGRESFGLFFNSAGFMHTLFISIEGLAGNLLILASVKYLDVLTIAAIYTLKSTIVPILSKLIIFNHLKNPPAFSDIEPSWNVILGTLLAFVGTATVVIFASMRRSFVSRRISTSKRKKVPNPYNRRARKEEKKRLKRLAEEKAAAEAAIAAGAILPSAMGGGSTD